MPFDENFQEQNCCTPGTWNVFSCHVKAVSLDVPWNLNIDNCKHVVHRCHWFSINAWWLLFLARAVFKVHHKQGCFLHFFCFFSSSCVIACCDCSGNATSSKARMAHSETWSIKPTQRAFCVLVPHSLVNHNEYCRIKKKSYWQKWESGQVVQIFKKYMGDSYYGIKVLISPSLPLTACSRKQFIVNPPERLSLWRDIYHLLLLSLSSFCPLSTALFAG